MVVRIRLQRHGRIHRPFYRIAVADSQRHVSKKVIDYIVSRTTDTHHTTFCACSSTQCPHSLTHRLLVLPRCPILHRARTIRWWTSTA